MNKVYKKKRLFWFNLDNFNKPGIKSFGIDEIIVAGVEFNMCDSCGYPRNLFIAVNSSGDSDFYYEKDSKDGIGQIIGEHSQMFNYIINNFLNEISELTYNMDICKILPKPPELNFINFFALGYKGKFYKKLTYKEVHCKEHPYYLPFTYIRYLLSEMRKTEILRLQNKSLKKFKQSK
ncbi:MAG: hypothetical protein J5594_03265 [Elusimicrobiaceae bacterium]|nr:hypothetical protein [Elusimicrobiaceae bacterium]